MRCGNIAAMRALLSVIAAFSLAAQADSLPVFPASNVPETFFGTVVDDPYRAMENEKDPAVASWM
jgi:prolyl oligopeptidase